MSRSSRFNLSNSTEKLSLADANTPVVDSQPDNVSDQEIINVALDELDWNNALFEGMEEGELINAIRDNFLKRGLYVNTNHIRTVLETAIRTNDELVQLYSADGPIASHNDIHRIVRAFEDLPHVAMPIDELVDRLQRLDHTYSSVELLREIREMVKLGQLMEKSGLMLSVSPDLIYHPPTPRMAHPRRSLDVGMSSTTKYTGPQPSGRSNTTDPNRSKVSRAPSAAAKSKVPRTPTPYNLYMKDEMARIKAADPELSHNGAFNLAEKHWRASPENPKNQ